MKRQFCLRSIPDDLWQWVEESAFGRRQPVSAFIIETLNAARRDGFEPTLFDGRPIQAPAKPSGMPFKFIDLFAGIGGFRLGLQAIGGNCVFTSEWDKFCQQTYEAWFGDRPHGDINEIDPGDIPDHDLLAAGFPCQPFSIAGVSKKRSLGQSDGFDCKKQGNLFFKICEIIDAKRPPVLMLENVKNLKSHDKRRTWQVIHESLLERDYVVFENIIDARAFVPQHRERIVIVGFDASVFGNDIPFAFPELPKKSPRFASILESSPDAKYTLTDHLWGYLQDYAEKHRRKGNGFGYGLTDLDGVSRTLSARYYKDGSEVLIPQKGRNPRRLTIVEAARLMGFGQVVTHRDDVPVSDTQAYKQFGNAVVPAVIEAVGKEILAALASMLENSPNGCLIKRASRRKSSKRRAG